MYSPPWSGVLCASVSGGSRKRIAAIAAQGKCSFPWDGIGLVHKRQLRFHRAVCKTAISPERCIIAPFILKGFGRCCVRERHAPSLQAPARLQAGGTRFSAVPSPDHRSILPDRPENFPAFRHECKDDTVYILSWEQRGISNTIMGNISQDEIARIAENIFNMSLHVIC